MNAAKTTTLLAALALLGARAAHAGPLETAAAEQGARQAVGAQLTGMPLVGVGDKTDFNIMLQGNTCYWFSGVAEAAVKRLSLYLWAPGAGTFTPRVADARPEENRAVMAHCTGPAGMYKLQAKIEGKGAYSVVQFAKAAPAPAPAAAAPEPAVVRPAAVTDLSPLCDRTAQASAPGATRVGDFASGRGGMFNNDVLESPLMLEAGTCYWVVGCGKPGDVKTLSIRLLDGNNQQLAAPVSNSPNPVVGYCAALTGMYKYVARVNFGKGEYMVGLYARRPVGGVAPPPVAYYAPAPVGYGAPVPVGYGAPAPSPGPTTSVAVASGGGNTAFAVRTSGASVSGNVPISIRGLPTEGDVRQALAVSAALSGGWLCLPGLTAPMRRAGGDVQCASSDGHSCLWGSCPVDLAAVEPWRGAAGSAASCDAGGPAAYARPDTWCRRACTALACPR